MICNSRFVAARVFLRDGKVIDISGMDVDEAARFVTEIERLTYQGVVIVEDGVEVDNHGRRVAARPRGCDS